MFMDLKWKLKSISYIFIKTETVIACELEETSSDLLLFTRKKSICNFIEALTTL